MGTTGKPIFKTHVALGEDIPSSEEKKFMAELQAYKKEKNSETKTIGSLRPYIRFANQYSCKGFTEEVASRHLERVVEKLTAL